MKFNNILFPIDFSDCSRALNSEVEYLANRFNANVTLLHVFEIPFTWYGSGEAPLMNAECITQYMESSRQRLREYQLSIPESRIHRVLAEGDAAWLIKNVIAENHIDLVAIGTHGYGTFRRLLLGSVAMKVLHDVACPVWTHSRDRALDGKPFERVNSILCALELNNEAIPLLRFASEFATQFNASVRLVHSVPDEASRPYRYFDNDLHRFLVKLADDEISNLQHQAGTYFNLDLVDTPIAQATANLASQMKADLVIIGRGKTQDVFGTIRTHTYDIIREAECPVLSFCAPEPTESQEPREAATANRQVTAAQ